MTVDDSDPNDRRDESPDEHDDLDEDADSVGGDESTDVPIDDSSSADGDPTSDENPMSNGDPSGSDDSESADRRSNERDVDESRVGASPTGSGPGDDNADTDEGGSHWLSSLLSALESLDSGSTSGRRRTDRTVLDYDISVRSGDDVADESRFERTSFTGGGSDDRNRHSDQDRGRSRKRRRRSSSSDGHLTTRRHDDELLVTADVAGTDPDDVTVGFDDSTLVVAVSGSELDRIEVPWRDRTAEATIKNGVLTVLIEPSTGEDASTETESEGDDE
ncbi:Hsp20/alpha crystallin family protein [Natronorubrum sp. FCH18a]|uniref:Hsp20/alpha crystallin family protein n=1 Tax=Natronorubrum sp. FCH18a TaxID=3447018 RepID=UPI003F51A6E4